MRHAKQGCKRYLMQSFAAEEAQPSQSTIVPFNIVASIRGTVAVER
jgi:hypothetical protein